MDDVLCNTLHEWIKELNARHGTNVLPADITTWDIAALFPTLKRSEVFAPTFKHDFWQRMSPQPGSVEMLKHIIDDGHSIKVVTATHYLVAAPKFEWLLRNFPYLSMKDIIIAHDKQMIRGDVLIDDAVHNLEGGEYEKILFSAPHNLEYDTLQNGMCRASNWNDVYDIVNFTWMLKVQTEHNNY
jgi:5'(3')-deoxyribonucleotidase